MPGRHLTQRGRFRVAARIGKRTALGKPAAGRQLQRIGHLALNGGQARLFAMQTRNRSEQPNGIRMLRRVKQRVDRALFDHPAGVHHHHIVGDLGHHAEVVGDQDDGGAGFALQQAHQLQNLCLDRHVERRGRFVGDQQAWFARQGHGNHHALAHAAGELVRVFVKTLLGRRDTHRVQHLQGARTGLLPRERPVSHQALDDLFAYRESWIERGHRLLENHRHAVATQVLQLRLGQADQFAPFKPDGACGDAPRWVGDQTHDGERRYALAAAGLAHDGQGAPSVHRKTHSVHCRKFAVVGAEQGAQALHFQQCAHCFTARSARNRAIRASISARSVSPAGLCRPARHDTKA